MLFRVIDPLTLVPENVVPVPANLEETDVLTKFDELAIGMIDEDTDVLIKFDELATGMIDEETDVLMNEPVAPVPRKFDELATGMMDEELLSAM